MSPVTIDYPCHIRNTRHGQQRILPGETPEPLRPVEPGRIPRLTKLMALAIRFEEKLQEGHVSDMAQLARLGHVSRARLTQIMNLRLLAPDIQEELLLLPRVTEGRAPLKYRDLLPIIRHPVWKTQREKWSVLVRNKSVLAPH